MLYLGTVGFHFLQGFLAFLSVFYLLAQRENFQVTALRRYFTWFTFFIFYNIALIISTFVYDSSVILSAVGYYIGLLLLAIGAWQAFLVAMGFLTLSHRTKKTLAILYIAGAFLAVGLHLAFFEVPQTLNAYWILWYPNQVVAIPYILFMFLAGWTFSFSLARALFLPSPMYLKARALFMSISGFILPFAALFYFAASKLSHVYASFGVVAVGMIFFALANIGVGMLRKRER